MAGKKFAAEFALRRNVSAQDKILIQDSDDDVVKYAYPPQIASLSGYAYAKSIADLPLLPTNKSIGYIVGQMLYIYVGMGGDTKDGLYQSVGFFVGPQGVQGEKGEQGERGEQGIQGPKGDNGGLSLQEIDDYLDSKQYITGETLADMLAGYVSNTSLMRDYVTIAKAQDVTGVKNFTAGVQFDGVPMYKSKDDIVYLDGNLVVRGAVTMYGANTTTSPSIFSALPIDGKTIGRNERGELYVIGGTSGGGGGVADSVAWEDVTGKPSWIGSTKPTYSWAEITGRPTVLSAFTNDSGYITSSALNGYATQEWVNGKNYLTGITSKMVTDALGYTPLSTNGGTIKGTLYLDGTLRSGDGQWWMGLEGSDGLAIGTTLNSGVRRITNQLASISVTADGGFDVSVPFIYSSPTLGAMDARGVARMTCSNGFGLYSWVRNTGDVGIQVGTDSRYGGAAANPASLYLQPLGGNVAMGGTYHHGDTRILSNGADQNNDSSRLIFGGHYDYEAGVFIQGINESNYGRKRLGFFVSNAAATTPSWVEAMSIKPDAKIGFGTTSPSERVDIRGNIALTLGNYNPYISLLDDSQRKWYIQYYQNYLQLGQGSGNSIKIDPTGNLLTPGAITMFYSSDRRLKRNIRKFNAAQTLLSLGGVYEYEYSDAEVAKNPTYAGTHYGLIYQNVAGTALGSMCYEREDGMGALNYVDTSFISLIAGATMENTTEIEKLKRENKALRKEIEYLKKRAS